MDREALIGMVEKKHHVRMDPDDPVFVLATITELMMDEAKAELQRIMTTGMDQVSAANVQAEAAARAKAEAIVTKAGEWAAERIREAGDIAVARILSAEERLQSSAKPSGQPLQVAMLVIVICSVAALAASAGTVVAMWVG
jgi:hypothetical protein